MVKKKWLEKGGVAPSNGVDSGSLCDKVRGVLKGANDSVEVRVSESGMRKIQEILETAINNSGHFLDLKHEPKVKLESLERALPSFFNS